MCQIFISHLYPELQGINIYLLISEKEINVTDSIITKQFKQFKYCANPNCILVRTLIKSYLWVTPAEVPVFWPELFPDLAVRHDDEVSGHYKQEEEQEHCIDLSAFIAHPTLSK